MAGKQYLIPFSTYADGTVHMCEWSSLKEGVVRPGAAGSYSTPTEWRKNEPFEAVMKLDSTYLGRSAARVRVINEDNGEQYSLTLSAFYDAVVKNGVKDGKIFGKWKFRKQGSNFGLVVV